MATTTLTRMVVRVAAAALLLVLLATGGALYWLGTPHALNWITDRAVAASAGRLVLDHVEGSLYDRITISRAAFKDQSLALEARAIVLQWQPLALLRGEARITALTIDDLRITSTGESAEPPQLPATLRLPLQATLADVRIKRIELTPDRVLQDLHFRLRAGTAAHELELLNIAMLDASATGKLRLEATAPYAASGKFNVTGKTADTTIKAELAVDGNLEALQIHATTTARGASAKLAGLLHPFSALPLAKLTVNAENLDLAGWNPAWPHTKIRIALEAGMPAPEQFAGTLNASNELPGTVDAQRVPLTSVRLAFSGSATQWEISAIDLGIGGGHIRGSGIVKNASTQLTLMLTGINTAELHRKLKPLAVSGRVTLTGDADAQQMAAKLDSAGIQLELAARHARQTITVERGSLRAADGQLDFNGHAALTAKQEFTLNAKFSDLDPARFMEVPPARLNGTAAVQGMLVPQWQAQVRLAISNSRFRGQPLTAQADFTTAAQALFSGAAHATLAGNRLDVAGRFSETDGQLKWTLAAANLQAIDPALSGNIQAQGMLAGRIEQPAIDFKLTARNLTAGSVTANAIDAQGMVNAGADGALRLTARVAGIRSGEIRLDEIKLDAQGSRLRHNITAALRGTNVNAALKSAGGLNEQWRWDGSVDTLEAQGRFPLRLTAPARISVGHKLLIIEGLQAAALDGQIGPLSMRMVEDRITTRGTFTKISARALLALTAQTALDGRNLSVGGRWDFVLGETASGSASLYREQGDLGMRTERDLAFGLTQLKLDLTAQDNTINATLDALSTRMGTLTARAQTRLERRDAAWALIRNAPLEGNVALDMQSLAWVRALAPQLDQIDGRLAARITLAGTAGQPLITGNASADAVQMRAIGPGLNLRNGTLRADFDGGNLNISKFYIQAGDGKIEADGKADISNGLRSLDLNARAERARILASPDLTVVISGAGHAGLRDLQLALDGKFKVDEGRYDLGAERKPELGDDVTITGRTPAASGAKPIKIALDLTIDLSDNFAVRGHGLDAVLGGAVRIATRGESLQALGTIRTVSGEYFAFGQRLAIDRGELNFSGPLANPGLNLRAGRKVKAVEVGVEVSGSLQRPVVKLVSDPVMSDSERLGWLVLGRDPQTASAAELAILQAAALSSGTRRTTPLQKRIATGLGLDEFGVSQGSDGALGVVALGKRVTDQLSVRLEQSLGGAVGGVLKMDYLLSERWRLEGTAGAESAADVLYTLRFD